MIEIDSSLPAELAPLAFLVGVWEGTGVVHYTVGDEVLNHEFGQRVSFSHDGLPHLNYTSYTWLLDSPGDGADGLASAGLGPRPLVTEMGYWRLSRGATEGDPGPGMLPGVGDKPFTSATAVETLRRPDDGFSIEVSLVHPGGINELYLGRAKGARIDLATDAVMRTATAKPYAAATRIYGLVDNHLLWAWDIAALGQDLRTHASGRLARVD